MSFSLNGRSRRATKISAGTETDLRLTNLESLAVAQVEPEFTEIAKRGSRYAGGCQVIASGIAPVTAIPTTTATLALYNTDGDTGMTISVDQLSFCLGSGTPTAGATLLVSVSNGKVATAPSAASNYSSQSLTKTGNVSVARWATGVTIPASSAWFQATTSLQLAAANVGQGDSVANLKGILIPPGYALGIAILSGTGTTPLYSVTAMWSELELDLEP
jgi:hypothetical protein